MKTKTSLWLTPLFAILLIAAIICANLLFSLIPSRYTKLDMTQNRAYTLSESTYSLLASLNEDITLYAINADGTSSKIEFMLELYEEGSPHITVEYKSADELYDKLSPLGWDGTSEITPYCVLVESEKRAAFIDISSAYYYYHPEFNTDTNTLSLAEYQSYLSMLYQYAMYYGEAYQELYYSIATESVLYFELEPMISMYIDYTLVEIIPTTYYLTGHGSPDMTSLLGANLSSLGCHALDLASLDALPADASSIIINAPTEDLSDKETALLRAHLEDGGGLTILTNEANLEMSNLMSLLSDYKVSINAGIVAVDEAVGEEGEPTEGYNRFLLTPAVNPDHDSVYMLADELISMVNANHITVSDTLESSVIVTPLLTTAENAYIDGVPESAGAKTLAVAIEKEAADGSTKIVLLTGADSFADDAITQANFYLVAYALDWCGKSYMPSIEEIAPTLMSEAVLSASSTAITVVAAILVAVIPLGITASGIIICKRRRARKPQITE